MNTSQRPRISSKPSTRITTGNILDFVMVGLVAMAGIYGILQLQEVDPMEHCTTCSMIIQSDEAGNYTLTGGEVFCIAEGVTFSGSIVIRSQDQMVNIVNEGTFNPRSLTVSNGNYVFHNYGSASPVSFTSSSNSSGEILNYPNAVFAPASITLHGTATVRENHEQF